MECRNRLRLEPSINTGSVPMGKNSIWPMISPFFSIMSVGPALVRTTVHLPCSSILVMAGPPIRWG